MNWDKFSQGDIEILFELVQKEKKERKERYRQRRERDRKAEEEEKERKMEEERKKEEEIREQARKEKERRHQEARRREEERRKREEERRKREEEKREHERWVEEKREQERREHEKRRREERRRKEAERKEKEKREQERQERELRKRRVAFYESESSIDFEETKFKKGRLDSESDELDRDREERQRLKRLVDLKRGTYAEVTKAVKEGPIKNANIMKGIETKHRDDERLRTLFITGLHNYNWNEVKRYFKQVHQVVVLFVHLTDSVTRVVFEKVEDCLKILIKLREGKCTINGCPLTGEEHYISKSKRGIVFREEVVKSQDEESTDVEMLRREKEQEVIKRKQLQDQIQIMNERLERLQKEKIEKEEERKVLEAVYEMEINSDEEMNVSDEGRLLDVDE